MKLTTQISKFAQQAKFLPKVKIIGSKDFVVKSLSRDTFIAHTKNGCLVGNGDYLLSNTLVDLKVSTLQKMQMYWVRQLLR
ncbi:hypothetical protein OQI87_05510 [Lactobacillus kefiranofaciens]|uniref:hypothetical protein n=1 Tax=Lactobacillus kefiranofaciens TaxID=267818 RepID=UPI0024682D59|nr:hypothetical protein [Lactobacillus kefiranofaciens]MDH5100591.1 hypothetical protein [Lactobacillus kefiranofaciens]